MQQPAWLFPSLLSSAPLTPKGSTPGTSPPHPHLPDSSHASTHPHPTGIITLPPHLPRSPPLLRRVVWDTLVEEDTGGQEQDPGEVVRVEDTMQPSNCLASSPTHPHTHIAPAPSPFHHTFPAPLLSCAGWYGTPWRRKTREDKSGILVKWSGGGYDAALQLPRLLPHTPTSSSPHKDAFHTSLQGTVTPRQLHSAHRWIRHPFLLPTSRLQVAEHHSYSGKRGRDTCDGWRRRELLTLSGVPY